MPRGVRNPLPDLSDVDPIELQLAILVVLEERLEILGRAFLPCGSQLTSTQIYDWCYARRRLMLGKPLGLVW
jgi:hypothetical protein